MLPVRSTTAADSVSLPSAVAAIVSTARTSSAVRIWAAPPAEADGVFWERRMGAVATIRAAVARYLLSRTPGILSQEPGAVSAIRPIRGLAGSEPLAVAAAGPGAVAGLVLATVAHVGLVAG